MSAVRFFAGLFGCSLAALSAPINTPNQSFTTLVSTNSQTVNNPLAVTQNLFSTQIIARGLGGQVVFDQTLHFAFADPAVQALVAQASLALNGIGAASILGPSLISTGFVSEGTSVVTRQTGSREDSYLVGTTVTFGPDVVTTGEMECQSFAITGAGSGVPSGCTGGTPYVVGDGSENFHTWNHVLTTIFQDVTTTETFRTRQVYLLQAQDGGSAVVSEVPEPGTLGLLLAGAPAFFALRRRRRTV